jgi:hypothetical protein
MRNLSIFLSITVISFILFVSCIPDTGANGDKTTPTYTLTGTLNCTTTRGPVNPANGKTAYLKLVSAGGDSTADALYGTSTVFSDANASYSVSGVAKGTYSLWVFIDMDDDAVSPNYHADQLDYILSASKTVDVTGDTSKNILDVDWVKVL